MASLDYTIAPDSLRKDVYIRRNKNLRKNSALLDDLLDGKTLLFDEPCKINEKYPVVLRNMYAVLASRGYRLRVHVIDNIDKDLFRRIIAWAEPLNVPYFCTCCGEVRLSTEGVKPSQRNCPEAYAHFWKKLDRVKVNSRLAPVAA